MTRLQIDLLVWLQERARTGDRMLGNTAIGVELNVSPQSVHCAMKQLELEGRILVRRIASATGFIVRKVMLPDGEETRWSLRNQSEPAAIPPDEGRYVVPEGPRCPHTELGRRLHGRRYGPKTAAK